MESDERIDAVTEMLQGFVQKPADERVRVVVKRTMEFTEGVLKRACVRLLENSDRTPTIARLRECCTDISNRDRSAEPLPEGCEGDWLDQLFADGHLRKTKEGATRAWIHLDARPQWRLWAQDRLNLGWSEEECARIIRGEYPRDWDPRDLEGRNERTAKYLSRRSIRIAGESYSESDLRAAAYDKPRDVDAFE